MAKKKITLKESLKTSEKISEVPKRNVWKIISIICILIFIAILISGLIRSSHFREKTNKASDAQIATAKNIATSDLISRGETIDNYQFKSSGMIRSMEKRPRGIDKTDNRTYNENSNILEVYFYNNTTINSYIINVDTGSILVYTKTVFNDGLDHSKDLWRIPIQPGPFRR